MHIHRKKFFNGLIIKIKNFYQERIRKIKQVFYVSNIISKFQVFGDKVILIHDGEKKKGLSWEGIKSLKLFFYIQRNTTDFRFFYQFKATRYSLLLLSLYDRTRKKLRSYNGIALSSASSSVDRLVYAQ